MININLMENFKMPRYGTTEWANMIMDLKENKKSLTDLDLLRCVEGEDNPTKTNAVQILIEALKTNNNVRIVIFGHNQVNAIDIKNFINAINTKIRLTYLRLGVSSIDVNAFKIIAEALKNNKTLIKLAIDANQLGDSGVRDLFEAIQGNHMLMAINLQNNGIGNTGAKTIINALKENYTLIVLHVEGPENRINTDNLQAINHYLTRNKMLSSNLHVYIKRNNINEVQKLLSQGVNLIAEADKDIKNIDDTPSTPNTPLHLAIQLNHFEIAQILIQAMRSKGLHLQAINREGKTAEDLAQGTPLAALFTQTTQIPTKLSAPAESSTRSLPVKTTTTSPHQAQITSNMIAQEAQTRRSTISQPDISRQSPRPNQSGSLSRQTSASHPSIVSSKAVSDSSSPGTSPSFFYINRAKLTTMTEVKLGEGGFGTVYRGNYGKYRDVAIKQFKNIEDCKKEAEIIARLRSPHIVTFYGVSLEIPYSIVTEYMINGSLYQLNERRRKRELVLDEAQQNAIILGISYGLAYLHEEGVRHRDLKSPNVLIDAFFQPKLCDFGLSRVTESGQPSTSTGRLIGTYRWMAPELLEDPPTKGSDKSDIYSYGVVLWEVATCQVPYENINQHMVPGKILGGETEIIPTKTSPRLAGLIRWCWKRDPQERPDMDQTIAALSQREETSQNSFSRINTTSIHFHSHSESSTANRVNAISTLGLKS